MNEPIPAEASAVGVADPIDLEHLKLLSIFHFIVGAITILFSSIFIIHVVLGVMMAFDPERSGRSRKVEGQTPPEFPPGSGLFMAVFAGSFVILTGWMLGGLTIYSGHVFAASIAGGMFSLIIAAIQCMFVPFGTCSACSRSWCCCAIRCAGCMASSTRRRSARKSLQFGSRRQG